MTDRLDPGLLVDLLADHDAGLPVDPEVLAHPRARTILDALATTRAELAAAPPVPVPPVVTARWSAALAATVAEPGPTAQVAHSSTLSSPNGPTTASRPAGHPSPAPHQVGRSGPPSPRRPATGNAGPGRIRRPRAPRPALVAGLLLIAGLLVAGLVTTRTAPSSITAAQLGGIARAALGIRGAGAFTDPVRRAACLRTVGPVGLSPDAPLAGGMPVVFEGHPGVILLLITGELGVFRAVVVDPDCGPGRGTLLADTRVGR